MHHQDVELLFLLIKNKVKNLEYYKREITSVLGDPVAQIIFQKIGNIGVISITNLYHTVPAIPTKVIDFPSWFVARYGTTGALVGTSLGGIIAEVFVGTTQMEINTTVTGNASLSGSITVIMV